MKIVTYLAKSLLRDLTHRVNKKANVISDAKRRWFLLWEGWDFFLLIYKEVDMEASITDCT